MEGKKNVDLIIGVLKHVSDVSTYKSLHQNILHCAVALRLTPQCPVLYSETLPVTHRMSVAHRPTVWAELIGWCHFILFWLWCSPEEGEAVRRFGRGKLTFFWLRRSWREGGKERGREVRSMEERMDDKWELSKGGFREGGRGKKRIRSYVSRRGGGHD